MSYVDSALLPGENVVFRTRLHWVVLIRPIALSVVLVALACAAVVGLQAHLKVPWYVIPAAFVVGAAWVGGACITRNSSEFAVTSQRIIAKTGFLRVTSLEMQLSKVDAVSLNQDVWGRLFHYGSVVIIGTGGTRQDLTLVESPVDFARHIQTNVPPPERGRPPMRY